MGHGQNMHKTCIKLKYDRIKSLEVIITYFYSGKKWKRKQQKVKDDMTLLH